MINKPIILVAGDPNSIFFEIFFKSLKKNKYKSPIIIICDKKIFSEQIKYFKFKKKYQQIFLKDINKIKFKKESLYLIDVKIKKNLKNYIQKSFNLAFILIRKNITNKLINGPINKELFLKKKYLGITEFVSKKFKIKNIGMLIYNKELSVCPLTTHLPIKLVSKKITIKNLSQKIDLIDNFFKSKLKIKAKIAVTGLNPHCESISKINEDKKILPKVINAKKIKGINISGPYPADTIFLKTNRKKFNVILGMYHDQVIGPLKTIFEYDAINITMGLPFMRVTPDHGPNINMFKKNKSNPNSLIKCLEFLDKR